MQEEDMNASARTPGPSDIGAGEQATITPTPAPDERSQQRQLEKDERVQKRQLEQSVSWTGGERLRWLWYRLRLTVHEMNYATRRLVELQTRLP
jgi:hypothetical protein